MDKYIYIILKQCLFFFSFSSAEFEISACFAREKVSPLTSSQKKFNFSEVQIRIRIFGSWNDTLHNADFCSRQNRIPCRYFFVIFRFPFGQMNVLWPELRPHAGLKVTLRPEAHTSYISIHNEAEDPEILFPAGSRSMLSTINGYGSYLNLILSDITTKKSHLIHLLFPDESGSEMSFINGSAFFLNLV